MKSFLTFINETVQGVYNDGTHNYSVDKLIKAVGNRQPSRVPVDDVIHKNKDLGTKEGNFADNVAKPSDGFKKRAMKADTQHPVLLDKEGYIVDGSHRVAKQKWSGATHIQAHHLTDDDFKAAKITDDNELKKSSEIKEEHEYRGQHQAPGPEDGSPMHDVTKNKTYPADFYSHNGFRYYSDAGSDLDRESHDRVVRFKDRPDDKVWIYRAVPKSVHKAAMKTDNPTGNMFRKGDWVTIHKGYAKEHGEANLNNDYKIAAQRVPASHLYTNGDSIHEWGYHPPEKIKEEWKTDSHDSKIYGKRSFATNKKEIDGHLVHTEFSGSPKGSYNLEYTVNGNLDKQGKIAPETGKKIVSHVGKAINTFIRHMKPKSLGFQSKYDRRIAMHGQLANRIAKKHGGRVETTETPGGSIRHTIHFDRNIKEELRIDNPGGDWLQRHQESAEKSYGRYRGITGAITAYHKDGVQKLRVDAIKNFPGARGEEAWRNNSSKLHDLEKDIGHPDNFNTKDNPIMVAINHRGEPHIQEGNHRLAYAVKHKIPHIHAEVRYYNGGEEADGPMHPSKAKDFMA